MDDYCERTICCVLRLCKWDDTCESGRHVILTIGQSTVSQCVKNFKIKADKCYYKIG